MEAIWKPFKSNGRRKRAWRRRKYRRFDDGETRSSYTAVTRLGHSKRPSWRIKVAAMPRLRRWRILSLVRLWSRLKNAYINMMLHFAGGNASDQKRLTDKKSGGRRSSRTRYTKTEFENRLIYEIYKSLVPSMELYPM